MQLVLDDKKIAKLLDDMAAKIHADVPGDTTLALVGIRSRGETLAQRLQNILREQHGLEADRGTLDVTLYRDDLNEPDSPQATVRATEIDFNVDDRLIVLVDDVLSTGRSIRAALDALIDLGRPRAIRLAVLIDRGHRELPIAADYVGKVIDAPMGERVCVHLREVDDKDEVVLD